MTINPRLKTLLGSKTVWGTLLASAAWLINQPHVDIQVVLQAVGTVITAVGVRDAIKKNQPLATPDQPDIH